MHRLWDAAERDYRAQLLDALPVGFDGDLLDLGCDDGGWTEQLRLRLGVPPESVHGLEIVPERAELARRRGFDVRVGDLDERWPFDDSSVDLVHANQVIEHVHRLDHFAAELQRILRRGGCAFICTENLASWHNVAALALGYQPFSLTNVSDVRPIGNRFALHAGESPGRASWQHVHVLTLTALRDIFEAHGFTVEDGWAAGYHPLPAPLAARAARLDPRHAHFVGLVVRACS